MQGILIKEMRVAEFRAVDEGRHEGKDRFRRGGDGDRQHCSLSVGFVSSSTFVFSHFNSRHFCFSFHFNHLHINTPWLVVHHSLLSCFCFVVFSAFLCKPGHPLRMALTDETFPIPSPTPHPLSIWAAPPLGSAILPLRVYSSVCSIFVCDHTIGCEAGVFFTADGNWIFFVRTHLGFPAQTYFCFVLESTLSWHLTDLVHCYLVW